MNCMDRVQKLMNWDDQKVMLWFQTKNPLLGDVSPDEMIQTGRLDRLKKFIAEAESVSEEKELS